MTEETILHIEIRSKGNAASQPGTAARSGAAASNKPLATTPNGLRSAGPSQLMRLISERNVELLRMIKTQKPQSVAELARLSGRPKESLTRTLQRMSALGIVVMKRSGRRGKVPHVACDRLRLELPIEPSS